MIRKSIATTLKVGAVVFLLFAFLFVGGNRGPSPGFIVIEVTSVFRDPGTQWMVFLCLGVHFTTFLFLRTRIATGFLRAADPNLWLTCALLISAVLYAIDYSQSTQALTLLAGAVLGQGAAVWAGFNANKPFPLSAFRFPLLFVSLLVILLALASVWQTDASHIFEYQGHTRWSGPWDNPNIAGLLMGAGATLAAGLGMRGWKMEDGKRVVSGVWRLASGKFAVVILCFLAVILMSRCLLHSYSRGAWIATFCGAAYLIGSGVWRPASGRSASKAESGKRKVEIPRGSFVSWLNNNWLSLSVILLSVVVLSFWHFQQTEWHPAHRAFSVSNQNDFSWRNRLSAWEGALQMMTDKPMFGLGWNQPEQMYDYYYRTPKVVEGRAVQLNDYLMLGATFGIPALFCFGMYLGLSLFRNSAFSLQPLELLPATCRAGAIVLLVGFWFDGGLFKLATASIFWILLELGRADLVQQKATEETKMHPIVA
jgi:O-antigen ligase